MASTEQLERETEQTRARLTETLEELRAMTPGRVIDEVLDYAKEGGSDLLRGVGHQISQNPLPAALIGAGIMWMLMGNSKSANGNGNGAIMRANGSSSEFGESYSGAGSSFSGVADSARDTASDWGAKASSAARSVKDTAQSAASTLSNAASTLGEKASSAYGSVAETASRTKWAVKDAAHVVTESTMALEQSTIAATRSMFDFCKDQPLVLAGLGLAIGAALGAAIPETRAEDRLMGETADQLKEQAQQLATDKLQMAKAVGEHMVDETAKLAKEQLSGVLEGQGQTQGDGQNQGQSQNQGQGQQQGDLSIGQSGMGQGAQSGIQSDEENAQPGQSGADVIPMGDRQQPFH